MNTIIKICLIFSLFISFQAFADTTPVKIDKDALMLIAASVSDDLEQEISRKKNEVKALKYDLEVIRDKGAQKWFRKATKLCGAVVVISAVTAVASGSKKFGHLFGNSQDERLGGAVVGFIGVAGGTVCAGLTGLLYELTNGDVELQRDLVSLAELELEKLKRTNNKVD